MNRYVSFLAVLCVLSCITAQAAVQYTVIDLGTLGGSYSYATQINASGQVVGFAEAAIGQFPFLYSGGKMINLGGGGGSIAFGINDSGLVVGFFGPFHAFLYSGGNMQDLGTLYGDTGFSSAEGINATNQIVGESTYNSEGDAFHAFLYSGGNMTDLGALMNFDNISNATAINDSGEIVVNANSVGALQHAFLYSCGKMTDLGDLGGGWSEGREINARGQIVGHSATASGDSQAFLYSNGSMKNLNTIGLSQSMAYGINSNGQVVGMAITSNKSYAFLYTEEVMIDLNNLINPSSGLILQEAVSINDSGQIVCNGLTATRQAHAFLLTPVPEPSAISLIIVGTFSLLTFALGRG